MYLGMAIGQSISISKFHLYSKIRMGFVLRVSQEQELKSRESHSCPQKLYPCPQRHSRPQQEQASTPTSPSQLKSGGCKKNIYTQAYISLKPHADKHNSMWATSTLLLKTTLTPYAHTSLRDGHAHSHSGTFLLGYTQKCSTKYLDQFLCFVLSYILI